jgi:hypothetical protein
LTTTAIVINDGTTPLYRASKQDCRACALKAQCCPNTPARKVPRSIFEGARDLARAIAKTEAYAVSDDEIVRSLKPSTSSAIVF